MAVRAIVVAITLLSRVLVVAIVAVLTIIFSLSGGILDGMGRKPARRRYAKR